MIAQRKYTQGSLWRTRAHLSCYHDGVHDENGYIPFNKIVLFLEIETEGWIDNVKVLYDGKICYLSHVDIEHQFDLNPSISNCENYKNKNA